MRWWISRVGTKGVPVQERGFPSVDEEQNYAPFTQFLIYEWKFENWMEGALGTQLNNPRLQ